MTAERERVAGFGHLEDGLRQAGDWYRRRRHGVTPSVAEVIADILPREP